MVRDTGLIGLDQPSLSTLTVIREEAGGGGGGVIKKKDVKALSWLNDWAARQSMLRPDVTL